MGCYLVGIVCNALLFVALGLDGGESREEKRLSGRGLRSSYLDQAMVVLGSKLYSVGSGRYYPE